MSRLKAAARSVRDSEIYRQVTEHGLYGRAMMVGAHFARPSRCGAPSDDGRHLLYGPTGGGNIGDQALFESYLDAVEGDVEVLVVSATALRVPVRHQNRVKLRELPSFSYMPPVLRWWKDRGLARSLSSYRSVAVIGADLMDGKYNATVSLARILLLKMAARAGVPSVLLGCSWASDYVPATAQALANASRAGVDVCARDALSLERMRTAGIPGARLTADIVFLQEDAIVPQEFQAWRDDAGADARVAVVNASGLVGKMVDQTEEYRQILEGLAALGFRTVLVPHVLREPNGDLSVVRNLTAVAGPGALLIERELEPTEVRGLAAQAEVVVTGRMHLAVMSLGQGVIPVTLGTHGKVEGMYEHFGLEGFCVQPRPGFGAEILDCVHRSLQESGDWAARLNQVRALAASNFDRIISS